MAPEILKGRDLWETPPLNIAVVWAVAPLTLAADVDTPGVSLGGTPGLPIVSVLQGALVIVHILEYLVFVMMLIRLGDLTLYLKGKTQSAPVLPPPVVTQDEDVWGLVTSMLIQARGPLMRFWTDRLL